MSEIPVITDRLDSWKEIASYVGRNVRTVIRWEQGGGLPVHRIPVGQRQAVFAYRHEIDAWLQSGVIDHDILAIAAESLPATPEPTLIFDADALPRQSWIGRNVRWIRWAMAAAAFLAVGGFVVHSLTAPRQIRFTGITQLTNDGAPKDGLVTDGKELYFGERREGRIALSTVSVDGGPIRVIPTPMINALPESMSPDGKQLLALARVGEEQEHALWIVRVNGGGSRQVGKIFCHSAAWSPNGLRIAYSTGNGIYLNTQSGDHMQQLQSVAGVPEHLNWSLDGRRLRFELRDVATGQSSLWELALAGKEQSEVVSLTPLHVRFNQCCQPLATLDNAGRAFISVNGFPHSRLGFLEKSLGLSGSRFATVELSDQLHDIYTLAVDRNARKLFAVSGGTAGNELLQYNRVTREFKPLLPGIDAKDVSYSRDGQWIAYVEMHGKSLWVSRADGSQRRQIEVPALEMELPSWAPDGRSIAFMARLPDSPWRIFVVPTAGGSPSEASSGTDNQGAPTWSPDGRWLMYGNVKCQEVGSCAIRKVNLSTGQVLTLPGSEGMGTARWSPNGRYVAALNTERHQVYTLDVHTGRWQKMADNVSGNDLNWSADSRYLFASRPIGDKPEVLRMSLANGKVESAVDLSDFSKMGGRVDTWFGIAPDGSIIFMRWLDQTDVYSLKFEER